MTSRKSAGTKWCHHSRSNRSAGHHRQFRRTFADDPPPFFPDNLSRSYINGRSVTPSSPCQERLEMSLYVRDDIFLRYCAKKSPACSECPESARSYRVKSLHRRTVGLNNHACKLASNSLHNQFSASLCCETGSHMTSKGLRQDRSAPDRAKQGRAVAEDGEAHGLQAFSGRRQDVAPLEGREPVASGHRRGHIHRRWRRKRHRRPRRLI